MFIYQQRWRLKKKPGLEPRDNGRNKRPNKQKIKPLASLQQTKSTKCPPEQLIATSQPSKHYRHLPKPAELEEAWKLCSWIEGAAGPANPPLLALPAGELGHLALICGGSKQLFLLVGVIRSPQEPMETDGNRQTDLLSVREQVPCSSSNAKEPRAA